MWVLPSTSYLSSPELGELNSDSDSLFLLLEQSLTWRGKPSPVKSWRTRWKKEPWLQRLSGRTLRPSTDDSGAESWIASLAASRAKTSATPVVELESTASEAGSGSSTSGSFAKWDRDTSSWRTSQPSSTEDLTQFSGRWPTSGSMRSGMCSQRPKSERLISESASSSWPTPRLGGFGPASETALKHGDLEATAQMWPTPRSSPNENRNTKPAPSHGLSHGRTLAGDAVMWYMPRAGAEHFGQPHQKDWNDLQAQAATHQALTETGPESRARLNPAFVEWLMGFPIGWTDLEHSGMESYQTWLRLRGESSTSESEKVA